MAEGRSNAGIAQALVVSESAVAKHINNIFAKLDLPVVDADHRRVLGSWSASVRTQPRRPASRTDREVNTYACSCCAPSADTRPYRRRPGPGPGRRRMALSIGLAVPAPDADLDAPVEPENTEPTGAAAPDPVASAKPVTSESARRGRRPSRTANPGG